MSAPIFPIIETELSHEIRLAAKYNVRSLELDARMVEKALLQQERGVPL